MSEMRNLRIRISRGVGSNEKLWAVAIWRGGADMAGEFDVSDEPGWFDPEANGIGGMTGMARRPDGTWTARALYRSRDEWVDGVLAEWPGAAVERADDEPLKYWP